MTGSLGVADFAASFVLVLIVVGISFRRRLGLERDILWAALRAAVQLLAVGLVFTTIFRSDLAMWWSWIWVVVMVAIAGWVITRRASDVPGILPAGLLALSVTTIIVLGVVFGLSILDVTPVAVIVIAGITVGNTMPSVVLGTNRMTETLRDGRGQVEALLALGTSGADATIEMERRVLKSALTPQIERTKVVGLIALPGAMTGLLLAGTDPIDAVVLQLVVMFLVLGSVATSVVVMTRFVAARALTVDLRVADWIAATPEN